MSFFIEQFHYMPFEIGLNQTIKIGKEELNKRQGVYLTLVGSNGNVGIGELAPLEGLHEEDLDTAFLQLQKIIKQVLGSKTEIDQLDLERPLFNLFPDLNHKELYPSVIFCLEGAILGVMNSKKEIEQDENALNYNGKELKIPLCGLYIPKKDDSISDLAGNWMESKISVLKIKIGRLGIAREIEIINQIAKLTSGKISLRLDGNCGLSIDDYLQLCRSIPSQLVEYVEEPFRSLEDYQKLDKTCDLDIALDESLLKKDASSYKKLKGVVAYIIKPTLIGGLSKSISLIKEAHSLGLYSVISSTFDSPVALWQLALLANYQNKKIKVASGLGTFKYLSDNCSPIQIKEEEGSLIFLS